MKKTRLTKLRLKPNEVISDNMHIGLELETYVEGMNSDNESEHDDDACGDSAYSNREDYLRNDCDDIELIMINRECTRIRATQIYSTEFNDEFTTQQRGILVRESMDAWSYEGCNEGSYCSFNSESDGDGISRESIRNDLIQLTNNKSFKVVEDGSISGGADAEICWNYYISKETIKDNTKILNYLKNNGHRFNRSCGLHINVNNYLGVPAMNVAVDHLSFLWSFVAPSRCENEYCNRGGIVTSGKYGMIFHQTDRLEFRFFSPTFEPTKLNAYVALAMTVYKRLAGINSRLPNKHAKYLKNKMINVNGLSELQAQFAIDSVNQMGTIQELNKKQKQSANYHENECDELSA